MEGKENLHLTLRGVNNNGETLAAARFHPNEKHSLFLCLRDGILLDDVEPILLPLEEHDLFFRIGGVNRYHI